MCIWKYSQKPQLAKPPKYIPTVKWISWSTFTKHNVLQEWKWTICSYPNIQMTLTNMLNKTDRQTKLATQSHLPPLSMGFSRRKYLEWVAIPFSRWSFQPRDQTRVSCTTGGVLTIWATTETQVKASQTTKEYIQNMMPSPNAKHWKIKTKTKQIF